MRDIVREHIRTVFPLVTENVCKLRGEQGMMYGKGRPSYEHVLEDSGEKHGGSLEGVHPLGINYCMHPIATDALVGLGCAPTDEYINRLWRWVTHS